MTKWFFILSMMKVAKTTLMKMKETVLVRHTSALKPTLSDNHRLARIEYCLSMRDENKVSYKDMYDTIHIDEKWFFMTKDGECYILARDEPPPKRTTQHKGFISKVTHQCIMNCILEDQGGNDYSIPHMGKETLERVNSLPRVIDVTPVAKDYEQEQNQGTVEV